MVRLVVPRPAHRRGPGLPGEPARSRISLMGPIPTTYVPYARR